MIGAFELKLKRNGRFIKLAFQNRVLTRGLYFHFDYSVNNTNDSIISHIFLTGEHTNIGANTTNLTIPPVIGQAHYIDYVKPDFMNTANNLWVNELVFRFVPSETMSVKQIGTGTLGSGGQPDFFSLANIVDETGELAELILYPNDELTVTYKLTFVTSQTSTDTSIDWNILRSNRNWNLCGIGRRVNVVTPLLKLYYNKPAWTMNQWTWGDQFVGVGSNYRNITTSWNINGDAITDPIFKDFICVSGVLPRWQNKPISTGLPTLNHLHNSDVRDVSSYIANFNPDQLPEQPTPIITDFRYEWSIPTFSPVNNGRGNPDRDFLIKFKSAPLSLVILTINDVVVPPHIYTVGNLYGLTAKNGEYVGKYTRGVAVEGDRIRVYVLNGNGLGASNEITYTHGDDIEVWMQSVTTGDGSIPVNLTSLAVGYGFKYGSGPNASVQMAVVKDDVPLENVAWTSVAGYDGFGYINTYVNVPVPADPELFTSNYILRMRYGNDHDRNYSIPLPQLIRGYNFVPNWTMRPDTPDVPGLPASMNDIGEHVGVEISLVRIT